jgi:hypothetical protein
VAIDKERVENFAVPGVGVKLGRGMVMVHTVLLEGLPQGREASPEQMAPSKEILAAEELVKGWRILLEFGGVGYGIVKVGAEACNEEVD